MFDKLGKLVARRPGWIVLAWCCIGLLAYFLAPTFEDRCQDDDVRFLPEHCLSVQGQALFEQAFPRDAFASRLIVAIERTNGPLTPADMALVDQIAGELNNAKLARPELALGAIDTFRHPFLGARLLSADRQCTLIVAPLESPFLAAKTHSVVSELQARLQPLLPDPATDLNVRLTGPAAMGRDLNEAAFSSLDHTTVATFVLVVVILLLIYRSPVLALIPLLTIAVSVWLSLRGLALLTLFPEVQFINVTRVFVVVVLYGAGTDYCLFLISRYREELQTGVTSGEAIHRSLGKVGGALAASAATVIVGLGMMGFAEFAKLRFVGPAIALSLCLALVACLTLAPALLCLLGQWAFWPCRLAPAATRDEAIAGRIGRVSGTVQSFWENVSTWVTRRPLRIWAVSVVVLLPLAIVGFNLEPSFGVTSELPRLAESRQGLEAIQRHFTAGEIGPLTVLLRSEESWTLPAGKAWLRDLTQHLQQLPNVAEVRSLSQPLGPSIAKPAAFAGLFADQLAQRHYVATVGETQVTRLDVVFGSDPFGAESIAAMRGVREAIQEQLVATGRGQVAAAYYGVTPLTHDIATIHAADNWRISGLILAGIFLILIGIVRRPLVAVYLLVSVLFSYYVTMGVTELVSYGWLESNFGQIDWKVPFFTFTILVAIGEDYNIFLMARVLEEQKRHGLKEATRRALARTGGIITSCGLIMAGTFATLMLCPLATLVQLGVALCFGVLLDTFVVRTVLVPAFLVLLERPRQVRPEDVPGREELRKAA